jgi:glutathione synthase/RimK-type ligase-like ATP-grasp enzyme
MKRLLRDGPRIFNTCNRYGKDEIHAILRRSEELRSFLPATALGLPGLKLMMGRFGDLILKPCRGSIGKGVMRLVHRGAGTWNWIYFSSRSRRWISVPVTEEALPRALRAHLAAVPYLVQERIPLAVIGRRPFDLRVTVQRGWGGEWQITGMFAKLAAPGGFVSNIARGGEALSSGLALEKAFPGEAAAHIRMAVGTLSLSVARWLEQSLPGLADIGLDIGIAADERLFFIECNGRDQRYGFRKAGLAEVWKDSYRRPMGYARFLLESSGP